jgi:hypothetical protein
MAADITGTARDQNCHVLHSRFITRGHLRLFSFPNLLSETGSGGFEQVSLAVWLEVDFAYRYNFIDVPL